MRLSLLWINKYTFRLMQSPNYSTGHLRKPKYHLPCLYCNKITLVDVNKVKILNELPSHGCKYSGNFLISGNFGRFCPVQNKYIHFFRKSSGILGNLEEGDLHLCYISLSRFKVDTTALLTQTVTHCVWYVTLVPGDR